MNTLSHLAIVDNPIMTENIDLPDKTGDINMHKGSHEVLTVKAVHDPTMSWNCISKIL